MAFAKTLIQMGADSNAACMQRIPFSKIRAKRQNIQVRLNNPNLKQGHQYFSAPVYSNSVVRQKSLSPYISGKLGVSFHRSQLQASYSGMSEKIMVLIVSFIILRKRKKNVRTGKIYFIFRITLQGTP